jgi:hypothetical protein
MQVITSGWPSSGTPQGLGCLIAAAGVIRSATTQRRQVAAPSPPSAPSAT